MTLKRREEGKTNSFQDKKKGYKRKRETESDSGANKATSCSVCGSTEKNHNPKTCGNSIKELIAKLENKVESLTKKKKKNKKKTDNYIASNSFSFKRKRNIPSQFNQKVLKLREDCRGRISLQNDILVSPCNTPLSRELARKRGRRFKNRRLANSKKNLASTSTIASTQVKTAETEDKPVEVDEEPKVIDKERSEREEEEAAIQSNPFEDYITYIANEEKWTAAFTVVKVYGRGIRALADTGATANAIAMNWVKYLNLENSIIPVEEGFVSAQGSKFISKGIVEIPITFGNNEFTWTFRVVDDLVCPIVIGMNTLHSGSVNLKERYVED